MAGIMAMVMLVIEAVEDIRTGSVSAVRLIIFAVIAGIMNIIMAYQTVWSMLGGMAVGAVLLLYARITSESIGYGDCLIFICAGAYIGFADNIKLLFFSLAAVAVAGGVYSLVAHKSIKARIPFVPCIASVYFIIMITGFLKGKAII